MRFRPNARLDPSQVEDVPRRRQWAAACPGSRSAAAGLGRRRRLSSILPLRACSRTARAGPARRPRGGRRSPSSHRGAGCSGRKCKTGKDANTHEDCRIVGYHQQHPELLVVGAGRTMRVAKTVFFAGSTEKRLAARASTDVGPFLLAPSTRRCTSTSASSTNCERGSGASTGPPRAGVRAPRHEYGQPCARPAGDPRPHRQRPPGTAQRRACSPSFRPTASPESGRITRRRRSS